MKKLKEERTVLLRGIFKKKGKLKNNNKKITLPVNTSAKLEKILLVKMKYA